MFNSPSYFKYAKYRAYDHLCSAGMQDSVREIHYEFLTNRRISSFKARTFLGLLTYTNDLRVPKKKKKSRE